MREGYGSNAHCRGRCRAQLFATKERYRCGLPLAGTHRPASVILHRAIVFECRGGRLCPPAKAPSASEEACCIPFPPGRRKLHIRSLLLPSQIVTVSLGHNLAIWNFTTPHAILMMAVIFPPTATVKTKTSGPDGLTFAPLFAMLWLEYMN